MTEHEERERRRERHRASVQEQQAGDQPEKTAEAQAREQEEQEKLAAQEARIQQAKDLPAGQTELEPGVRVEKKPGAARPVVRVAAEPIEDGVLIIDSRPAAGKLGELEKKVADKRASMDDETGALVDALLAEAQKGQVGVGGPRVEGPNPKDARGKPSDEPEPETPVPARQDPAFAHEQARRP